ncbi:MAG: AAA family ATPase [Luteolibacter sp.]|uniref:AAA family ATPase n=1 Tax=Luteolibacter sp. TaxID=1962973 RepID=UPI003263755D
MSAPSSPVLPPWAGEVIDLYESGASGQFILHGNVDDCLLLPVAGAAPRLVALDGFLRERLLAKFDVVISYDLGNGIRVEKGGERFAEWPPAAKEATLPKTPREAVIVLTHYLRFCANVARLKPERATRVAVIVKNAGLIVPPSNGGANYELSAIASQLREWAADPSIAEQHCTTFLLTENLNDLHPLVSRNPQSSCISVPLPQQEELIPAFSHLATVYPIPLKPFGGDFSQPAAALAGATLSSIETLLQTRQHHGKELTPQDLVTLKKDLVEKDAQGLIEFIKPDRTLDDLHGQVAIKSWLRQDIALWTAGDLAALPMGYLFCGPVGTGKTFMVECLAGEAGVPVVKMKNFRDKWVGSTESNLEKIFRLLDALGRCIVFVDEADQALGRRNADSGDSGVSGRVYGMMAERMSDSRKRGKILWVLATSRPDLVEVDLKRPGRVDVKIPLFPTATPEEGYQLIRALAKRRGVALEEALPDSFRASIPDLLTPGAAEALSVKLYRSLKTGAADANAALSAALRDYQPPVPLTVIHDQISLAVAEATDLSFVPERFRA